MPVFSNLTVRVSLGLLATYVVVKLVLLLKKRGRPPLPPGPRGWPILGNLQDLPKPGVFEPHHWLGLKKRFGPISSLTVLGKPIIIINDAQLAFELFDKRSELYSCRPQQTFVGEMVGWNRAMGMAPWNNQLRAMRKNISRGIGSNAAIARYHDLQDAEVSHFLLHMLESPEDLSEHLRKAVGTIVLKIAYGYNAEPHENDILIDMVHKAMSRLGRAAVPGTFMVDIFNILKYLPEWAPGSAFKATAREWSAQLVDMVELPYAFVDRQLSHGGHEWSYTSHLMEAENLSPEDIDTIKWSAVSLYTGGGDTSVSALGFFFLAMAMYPEVQVRAQEELDRVVGTERLPVMSDRKDLPYLEAIMKETIRWHPVAPMGLAHKNIEDDICNGYRIPKESMLFANIWHFTHDPDVYHDPGVFKPERFLHGDAYEPEPDPGKFVFGFGKRKCPGMNLAYHTIFLAMAKSLAVFSIGDGGLSGIDDNSLVTNGLVSHPKPYRSVIKPRSVRCEERIRSLQELYPWARSDGAALKSVSL
ncbi:cytochrome P450 [Xylariaceae sp. FL0255]|nr:cytochrome P450 [Xylariaceae sp. FL0255]